MGPQGWWRDDDAVADVLSFMRSPTVYDLPEYHDLVAAGNDRDVIPWEIEQTVLGRIQDAHHQKRGTCVGQGYARGVEFTAMVDMAIHNQGEEWRGKVAPASIYGASRVEVGGGRIRGEGSIGAWAARAITQYGVLYRQKYGRYDLTTGDEAEAMSWGSRGVPDELEDVMREHPIEHATQVPDVEAYKLMARQLKPVPVCSNNGYRTTRNEWGICTPEGSWAHCMLAFGIVTLHNGVEAVPYVNSWGNSSPNGPNRVKLASGKEIEIPPGWFLVEMDYHARALRRGDSFALAGMTGWSPLHER